MTERAPKRPRAISTEDESSEMEDDWQRESSSARTRRAPPPTSQPDSSRLRLTVKQPSSRLRNVTNASDAAPRPAREALGRASKNRRPIVDQSSDEDEEDEDDVDDDEEQDDDDDDQDEDDEDELNEEHTHLRSRRVPSVMEGDDEDEEMEDAEEDEEDEEDDDEEMDESMVEPPRAKAAPPTIQKPSPTRMLKLKSNVKSVEEKELESVNAGLSDDDELSDLESQDEDEEMDEDGDEAGDVIAADDVGEDELDSSELDSELDGSRAGTPDLSKLTRRQRAHFEEMEGGLMSLSNEAQKKKFFTPEQLSMRRAEMARRRKDLSERRNEEEKADTLNRLLHKQAPKRRTKAQILADAEKDENGMPFADEEERKASKLFSRTLITGQGTVIAVPEEWLAGPAGRLFQNAAKRTDGPGRPVQPGRLIEVIE